MSGTTATSVAVLGTGAMGRGIAYRLAETGHRVRVWNRTRERARFDHAAVQTCPSPGEAAAGASHVLLVLADDAALEEVMGESGERLAGSLTSDQVVLNLGTVRAETIRKLSARVPLVDVGVLGNTGHARSGELRFYVGGDAEAFEPARAVLEILGKDVRHVGPLGAGMDLKLTLNLLMGLEMQALAEVVTLAASLGLDRATILDTLKDSGFCAPVMAFKAKRMAAGKYESPDFRLALMTKDLGLAVQAAEARGLRLPMTRAAHASHQAACENGWGELDCAAIADALRGGGPS